MPTPVPGYLMRAARESDIPAIHALMREMAEFEKLTDTFRATHDSLGGWVLKHLAARD